MKLHPLMLVSMVLFLFGLTVCSAAPVGEYLAENNYSEDCIPEPEPVENFTNSIGMEFVKIPEGKFMMGSPSDEGRWPEVLSLLTWDVTKIF